MITHWLGGLVGRSGQLPVTIPETERHHPPIEACSLAAPGLFQAAADAGKQLLRRKTWIGLSGGVVLLCFPVAVVPVVSGTKGNAVLGDVAAVGHGVPVLDVMGVQLAGLLAAHHAAIAVALEDRLTESVPDRLFLLTHRFLQSGRAEIGLIGRRSPPMMDLMVRTRVHSLLARKRVPGNVHC